MEEALKRLHAAFATDGRFVAGLLRGKARGDTATRAVLAEMLGARRVLDVGGGYGTLPMLAGVDALVLDHDQRKIARGRAAARRLHAPVRFQEADVFAIELMAEPKYDCILCIDVLHYATLDQQRALVARLVSVLAPGGKLVIRDMDADLGFRTWITALQETFSIALRLTRARKVVPRQGGDLTAQLKALGMTVTATPCHGALPFSNTLWTAAKTPC